MSGEAKRLAVDLTTEARQGGAETVVVAVHRGGEWYVCFSGGSLAATGLAHQAVAVMQRANDGDYETLTIPIAAAGGET
jgi:hypothetical protein